MLTVIKRNGNRESFDPKKIAATLEAVSDEAKYPITESDIDSVVKELDGLLKEKTTITSRELYIVVVGLLGVRRMFELAKLYVEHNRHI